MVIRRDNLLNNQTEDLFPEPLETVTSEPTSNLEFEDPLIDNESKILNNSMMSPEMGSAVKNLVQVGNKNVDGLGDEILPDANLTDVVKQKAEEIKSSSTLEDESTSSIPDPFQVPTDKIIELGYLVRESVGGSRGTKNKIISGLTQPKNLTTINKFYTQALQGTDPNMNASKEGVSWCAAFVNHILTELGADTLGKKTKYDRLRANEYKNYGLGVGLDKVQEGDVILLDFPMSIDQATGKKYIDYDNGKRDGTIDHVGFYAGTRVSEAAKEGFVNVIGGNQGGQDAQFGQGAGVTVKRNRYTLEDISSVRRITYKGDAWQITQDQKDVDPIFKAFDKIEPSTFKASTDRTYAKGGSVDTMDNQMRMFEEGGIADDGLDRDPISGNEIPSGSLASEVRDDIPAQLSEGEYVVPADVVRFFGVKYFEDLRMEAKQGLQTMEQNGRIGGEPTMSQAIPQGNQASITDEDISQIEQMFASGVANGGLMDKVAYVAANDPVINKAFNKGGAVVSFAVGGSVQSPFNDPTKVDAVIGKFMQMIQSKPQIMEELSKRGIQVTRTGANQQPQQIQRDNSASQTTEPVMAGKPAPTPEPVRAAEGSYIKSPTMELPPGFNRGYGVPGQSLTYTGPGVSPAVPDVAVAAPSTAGAAVPTTDVIPQCPRGQEYDPKTKMCVPRQDYDGSKKDDTEPTKPNYSGLAEKYGDVNFSDPDQFAKYLEDVSNPGAVGGLAKAGSIVGTLLNPALSVVSGIIGSGGQVNGLANIRAGLVIAQASGNADLIKAAEKAEADFIDSAGWIVKEGPGSFMASDASARAQAILNFGHGDALKMEGLDITDQENWSDSERERFANIFNVDTQTRRDALIKGSAAAEELKARQRADEAAQLAAFLADEQAQASSGIVASGNAGVGNSYTSVAQQVQGEYDLAKKNREAAKKAGVDDDYYVGNKGGLVTRPKKKKK